MESIFELTPSVRAQIATLLQRASDHPLDYREAIKLGRRWNQQTMQQIIEMRRLVAGQVVVTYTHDLLPPDWHTYKHLAATYRGERPDDALFQQIAAAFEMGDPAIWLDKLSKIGETASGGRVRHIFVRR